MHCRAEHPAHQWGRHCQSLRSIKCGSKRLVVVSIIDISILINWSGVVANKAIGLIMMMMVIGHFRVIIIACADMIHRYGALKIHWPKSSALLDV